MADSRHKDLQTKDVRRGARAGSSNGRIEKQNQTSKSQPSKETTKLKSSRETAKSSKEATESKSSKEAAKSKSSKETSVKSRFKQVLFLVALLILVVGGSLLFVGAASGWFDKFEKTTLSAEYLTSEPEFIELTPAGYEELAKSQKSFVVFVDQVGCKTAVNLQGFLEKYMKTKGFSSYRLMFSDLKKTSLYDFVKYYPSVVIVDKGKVKAFLKADSDADAEKYNSEAALAEWLDENLEFDD